MSKDPFLYIDLCHPHPFKVGDKITVIRNKHGFCIAHRSSSPLEIEYGFKVTKLNPDYVIPKKSFYLSLINPQ